MDTKKKGAKGISRRQFLFIIIGLCAGALIAEGILLTKTFRKKRGNNTPTVTPTEVVASVSPTPTPKGNPFTVPEVDHYETVWRVACEYLTGAGFERMPVMSHEYDEFGREVKRVLYDDYSGECKETILFHYGKEGFIISEHWAPTAEDGTLLQKRVYFPSAIGVNTIDWVLDPPNPFYGEKLLEEKHDDEGNLILVTAPYEGRQDTNEWIFGSDGVLSKQRFLSPTGSLWHENVFRFDEYGRFLGFGEEPNDGDTIYREDDTIIVEDLNGIFTYVVQDGFVVSATRYMGYDEDWPGAGIMINADCYPSTYMIKQYRPKGHFPKSYFGGYMFEGYDPELFTCIDETDYDENLSGTARFTVSLRPDGQPDICREEYGGKIYEYDENGKLIKFTYVGDTYRDERELQLDDDWKLIRMRDIDTNELHEYEWISVEVPVYKY